MSTSSNSYTNSVSSDTDFASAVSSLSSDEEECVFSEGTQSSGIQPYSGEPVVSNHFGLRLDGCYECKFINTCI